MVLTGFQLDIYELYAHVNMYMRLHTSHTRPEIVQLWFNIPTETKYLYISVTAESLYPANVSVMFLGIIKL